MMPMHRGQWVSWADYREIQRRKHAREARWLLVLFVLAQALVVTGAGFLVNIPILTVGEDDADCADAGGVHDEPNREGCQKVCEVHDHWFIWGRDADCYWDDVGESS